MKTIHATLAVVAGLILSACGGGGGGTDPKTPSESQGPVTPDSVAVSFRMGSEGEAAVRVVDYLRVHASGGPWVAGPDYEFSHSPGLVRFASPPVVRIADTSTGLDRAHILYAVALINRALPFEQHLVIGPDGPESMYRAGDWQRGLPGVPDGNLFVKFTDLALQGSAPDSAALSHNHIISQYDAQQMRDEKKGIRAAAVEMHREAFRSRPSHQIISVLVHEILHGLGLHGHVPCGSYSDSNMCNAWFRLDGAIPAIDAAALQALYTRLGEATEPEELSTASLR